MRPDIYFFNPTCELAIANGSPYYTAPALLRKLEADLGYLPGWLGEEKDHVLVQGNIDEEFIFRMKALGFNFPAFIEYTLALADPEWIDLPKGSLCPWGWSPAVYQIFLDVIPSCQDYFLKSGVAGWLPDHKNLYSRLTALDLLDVILRKSHTEWLPGLDELPVVCFTLDQIQSELTRHKKAVVKLPWSSSGRGLLLFPNVDSNKKNHELLSGMLKQQGFVTVEPWLENVLDLSFQFCSQSGKISYQGRTFFETDRKGRYLRTLLMNNPDSSEDVTLFAEEHCPEVIDQLVEALSNSGYADRYEGWIGVDAMIYKSEGGSLKFHPMVEINGRYTMGAIALKIREYLAPESRGFMQVFYSKAGNFQSFCQEQESIRPLVMEGRKIISGFLPLTPPMPEHKFGAYIEVGIM
jgi:hypothetical protein